MISESKPFTLKGNQSAYTIIYSINSGKDEIFKKMQIYTIYGNKVYLITFTSQEALFAEYKSTIQEMINSFELLKTIVTNKAKKLLKIIFFIFLSFDFSFLQISLFNYLGGLVAGWLGK